MKKFLYLVLFVLIIGSISASFEDEWKEAKKYVTTCVQFLREKGLLDENVALLKKGLKDEAIDLCTQKYGSRNLCVDIIIMIEMLMEIYKVNN